MPVMLYSSASKISPMTKPILICGEAWGEKEAELGLPFVGPSGQLLRSTLRLAGIDIRDCHLTNVFNFRPRPSNDIKNLCGPKEEGIPGMPALDRGLYVRREYAVELLRLREEIAAVNPNIIIALGNTALWAITGKPGIKKARGATGQAPSGHKLLSTWHPAAVLRQMTLRLILLSDLRKAASESRFPEFRRPPRNIWIRPTIEDLSLFESQHLRSASIVGADIETKGPLITCIGFSADETDAIVVPFFSTETPSGNYWPTQRQEFLAWRWVSRILNTYSLVGQNFNYDMSYCWRNMGLEIHGAAEDTMLMHHALEPELEKGLGFLATLHTQEPSWKFMRKTETLKKED